LSKDTLNTFFDFKLAPTTSDLDLDKFPIVNLDAPEESSSYDRKSEEPSVIPEIVRNAKPDLSNFVQKCENCGKSIKNLKGHHCRKIQCEKCLKFFTSKTQLKKHQTPNFCPFFQQPETPEKQKVVSTLEIGKYSEKESFPKTLSMFPKVNCEKCFKTFLNNQQLKKHQMTYCPILSQSNSDVSPENRKLEQNTVPNENYDDPKEVIEIMNDSDAMNTNLNPEPIDLSIPTKVKCEKCSKMFVSQEELQKHLIYHCQVVYVPDIVNNRDVEALNANINPEPMDLSLFDHFKCDKCVKTFSSKLHLRTHQIYIVQNQTLMEN